MKKAFASLLFLLLLTIASSVQARSSLHVYSNEGRALGKGAGLVTSGWSPTWPTGLVAWYRADLGVTLTSAKVSTWADQSGTGDSNKNATQGTAAFRPTVTAPNASFGNQATLTWAGGQDMSTGTWATALVQPSTICVAYRATATSQQFIVDGLSVGGRQVIQQTAGGITTGALFAGSATISGTVSTFANASVLCGAFTGATSALYQNSAATNLISGNPGTNGLAGMFIGGSNGGTVLVTGDIAEVIVYSVSVSSDTLPQLFTNLRNRYGIAGN